MKIEFYKDKKGEWRWRMKAANHKIIATSGEGYKNRQDAVDVVVEIITTARYYSFEYKFEKE